MAKIDDTRINKRTNLTLDLETLIWLDEYSEKMIGKKNMSWAIRHLVQQQKVVHNLKVRRKQPKHNGNKAATSLLDSDEDLEDL